MQIEKKSVLVWTPFVRTDYTLNNALPDEERSALRTPGSRLQYLTHVPIPTLLQPLRDICLRSGIGPGAIKITLLRILTETAKRGEPCWVWPEEAWLMLYQQKQLSGPLLSALAFHLGDCPMPLHKARCRQPALYACAVFGHGFFYQELRRLLSTLITLGYSPSTQDKHISGALGMLMLENRDPRLEKFTEELLKQGQDYRSHGIARNVGKVSQGLAAMGILPRPLRMRGYTAWRDKSTEGIAPE